MPKPPSRKGEGTNRGCCQPMASLAQMHADTSGPSDEIINERQDWIDPKHLVRAEPSLRTVLATIESTKLSVSADLESKSQE